MTQQRVTSERLARLIDEYWLSSYEDRYDGIEWENLALDLRDCREECARLKADRRALAEKCVRAAYARGPVTASESVIRDLAARVLGEHDAQTEGK